MISAEIKINGAMIAHVYAVNVTHQVPPGALGKLKGQDVYRYEVHSIDSAVPTRKGGVKHHRDDGALLLIEKVIATAVKKKKAKTVLKKIRKGKKK